MTFEQCQAILGEIRHRQGTDHPLVEVNCFGSVVRGRLSRTDTDQASRHNQGSPYGLLVLEQPGLFPGPLTFVQIASIPEDGLVGMAHGIRVTEREPELVAAGR